MHFETRKVNWITMVFSPMDTTSVTIEIWVKAGSTYETRNDNWISHFLEHMFFKWGKKYKTPKEVTETIDNVWWDFNAYTWREHTWYYVKVAPDYLELAVDVLSDMLVRPNFDKNEIEKEKWVIIQELKMNQDNPHKVLWNKFALFYYWDNPYWWPVIGTEENILSFTQEDLFSYKNSLYTKDNLVIAVAGNVKNINQVADLIWNKFKDLPEKKTRQKAKYPWIQAKEHIWFYKKWVEQNHLILWIKGFSIFEEERFSMALLATILWWNMSSILFQELRERLWLCYYVSAAHYSSDEDWLFIVRAWLDKKNFKKWVEKINEILDEILKNGVRQEQLDKARNYLIWKTKMWIETSDEMTNYILSDYLSLSKVLTLEEIIDGFNKVGLEDIKKVSERLIKDNRYLYYLD